jgi:hypothetical protein
MPEEPGRPEPEPEPAAADEQAASEAADAGAELSVVLLAGRWVGPKWIDAGKHSVTVPADSTWSETVRAINALLERGELDGLPHCQLAGGEIDGAAAVALNAGHPELALLNFFTGSTQANLFSPTQV